MGRHIFNEFSGEGESSCSYAILVNAVPNVTIETGLHLEYSPSILKLSFHTPSQIRINSAGTHNVSK